MLDNAFCMKPLFFAELSSFAIMVFTIVSSENGKYNHIEIHEELGRKKMTTTTTINSAYDLKKRTAAESGIMKSIILTAARNATPERDDILLHDYQMATSTTLNSIFLNYLSCLDDAERRLEAEG